MDKGLQYVEEVRQWNGNHFDSKFNYDGTLLGQLARNFHPIKTGSEFPTTWHLNTAEQSPSMKVISYFLIQICYLSICISLTTCKFWKLRGKQPSCWKFSLPWYFLPAMENGLPVAQNCPPKLHGGGILELSYLPWVPKNITLFSESHSFSFNVVLLFLFYFSPQRGLSEHALLGPTGISDSGSYLLFIHKKEK